MLKSHLQTTIWTLLSAGASQREIERVTGIDRKTIRGYRIGVRLGKRRRMASRDGSAERALLHMAGHEQCTANQQVLR